MFLINIFLVGGIAYIGPKAYARWQRRRKMYWLGANGQTHPTSQPASTQTTASDEAPSAHTLTVSSVSVGFSLIGLFGYPLLTLISNALIFSAILVECEKNWNSLVRSQQLRWSVLWAIVTMGTLVARRSVAAALLTLCQDATALLIARVRRFNHTLLHSLLVDLDPRARQILAELSGAHPHTAWLLVDGTEVEVGCEEVKVEDTVVVSVGEVVPFDGTVVDGAAVLNIFVLTGQIRSVTKNLGDHVYATSRVMSGKIVVRVTKR
jgi:cation transport ATPase